MGDLWDGAREVDLECFEVRSMGEGNEKKLDSFIHTVKMKLHGWNEDSGFERIGWKWSFVS